MILKYLKDYCDLLLEAYAKELLKREFKQYEKDIFYLKKEFYLNKIIDKAKDELSETIQQYVIKLMEKDS